MPITQTQLKSLLDYSPETGVFIWKVRKRGVRPNRKAGSCVGGYIFIGIMGTVYRAHRLAWLYVHGEWPKMIDHINQDGTDNRMNNLREVSNTENARNTKLYNTNTSGIMGVYWEKRIQKWGVFIYKARKQKSLGYFSDKQEAIDVRKAAERELGYHLNHGMVST